MDHGHGHQLAGLVEIGTRDPQPPIDTRGDQGTWVRLRCVSRPRAQPTTIASSAHPIVVTNTAHDPPIPSSSAASQQPSFAPSLRRLHLLRPPERPSSARSHVLLPFLHFAAIHRDAWAFGGPSRFHKGASAMAGCLRWRCPNLAPCLHDPSRGASARMARLVPYCQDNEHPMSKAALPCFDALRLLAPAVLCGRVTSLFIGCTSNFG